MSKSRMIFVAALLCAVFMPAPGGAEFADVVINNRSSKEGVRPVVFPHWFHRIRFRCVVCHTELGFKMGAGANDIDMTSIMEGKYCGTCHNGEIAWSVENCNLCHSGKPTLQTGVQGQRTATGPGIW